MSRVFTASDTNGLLRQGLQRFSLLVPQLLELRRFEIDAKLRRHSSGLTFISDDILHWSSLAGPLAEDDWLLG